MKYRVKPTEIEALLFNYTPTGVAAMMFFAGDDFVGANKPRTHGAKGVATIAGRAVTEGQYIVRQEHDYVVMTREAFERIYEPVPQAPVQAPVQVKTEVVSAPAKVEVIRYATIADAARAARQRGDVTFQWHRPCPRGHNSQRYANGSACKQCMLERCKRTRQAAAKAKARAKARKQAALAAWPAPQA